MKDTREITVSPLTEATELERPLDVSVMPVGRYPTYRDTQAPGGFQLRDYWRAIRKRLWLVIAVAVLGTMLAAVYVARKPNVYQSTAKIQVDLEQANPDLVVVGDRPRAVSNPDPSYFNTQLQLLSSDALLRRAIKEHNLDTHPDFEQTKNEGSTSALRSILRSVGLATDDKKDRGSASSVTADSSLATADEIAEAQRLSPYVDVIHRNLDIEPVRESRATTKDTRLISLAFRNNNPELAAFVVNSIADTFTRANQEKRSGTSRKTNDFLQERIAGLQSDIQADEQKLVDLTQRAGILKTGEGEQTIVMDRLAGLNKQLLDAENDRKNAEANYMTLSKSPEKVRALADEQMARFITEQDNNIRSLQADIIKKIGDLRQDRAAKLQEYHEGAPEIREIDSKIQSYEDTIDKAVAKFQSDRDGYSQRASKGMLENYRTKYLQAQDKENKIRTDFDKQYNAAQGQNDSAVNIRLLQQNIETNRGFLDNLRKQVSGNDVAAQGTDNNISVIEIAIPSETPVSPRRLMTVAAAFMLSTLFGMGLALFLEYLDDTIRTTDEIETYLQLPALAAIPTMDSMPKRKLLLVGSNEGEETGQTSELLISADPLFAG